MPALLALSLPQVAPAARALASPNRSARSPVISSVHLLYRFSVRAGGEVVGYATVALCKKPHPGEDARDKALYLMVYVVGIDRRWQGVPHPERPDDTWAMAIFRWLEAKSREDGRCVGLYLRVRAANGRALAFYRKVGFSLDPASMGGEARDDALWVMRHRFEG